MKAHPDRDSVTLRSDAVMKDNYKMALMSCYCGFSEAVYQSVCIYIHLPGAVHGVPMKKSLGMHGISYSQKTAEVIFASNFHKWEEDQCCVPLWYD